MWRSEGLFGLRRTPRAQRRTILPPLPSTLQPLPSTSHSLSETAGVSHEHMAHLPVPSLAYLAAPALPFAPPVVSQRQSVPVLPPPVPPPSNPTSSRTSRLYSLPDAHPSAGSTVSARRHKVVFDLVRRHPPVLPPPRTPPSDFLHVALISICNMWRFTTSLSGVDRWRSLSFGRPAMSEALSRSVSHF